MDTLLKKKQIHIKNNRTLIGGMIHIIRTLLTHKNERVRRKICIGSEGEGVGNEDIAEILKIINTLFDECNLLN